jgi:hypothetical protein
MRAKMEKQRQQFQVKRSRRALLGQAEISTHVHCRTLPLPIFLELWVGYVAAPRRSVLKVGFLRVGNYFASRNSCFAQDDSALLIPN